MIENKKVIIFDMDGTLIDSIGLWNETDEKLIKIITNNSSIRVSNIQQYRDYVLTHCNSDNIYLTYCELLKKKYNSNLSPQEILDLRWSISDNYIKNDICYKPQASEVLHFLKNSGFTLALATTTTNVQLDAYKYHNRNIIDSAKLEDFFTIILSKDDVQDKKPNPEVHYKIMEKLGVAPEDCLIIEDSLVGVQAANNAGIEVAVIYDKFSDSDREEINRKSQYQFKDFNDMLNIIKQELSFTTTGGNDITENSKELP